jgi:hypothetical protein
MMTADAGWLSAIALGYLVAINAVANGCRLALRDTTAATADWPANLGRSIGAAATGTATRARKPARARPARPRRARQRTTTPRPAAVAGYGSN